MSDIGAVFKATVGYRNSFLDGRWILLADEMFTNIEDAKLTVAASVEQLLSDFASMVPGCEISYYTGALAGCCVNDGKVLFEAEGNVVPQRIHTATVDPHEFIKAR